MKLRKIIWVISIVFLIAVPVVIFFNSSSGIDPCRGSLNYFLRWNEGHALSNSFRNIEIDSNGLFQYKSNWHSDWQNKNDIICVKNSLTNNEFDELTKRLEKINFLTINNLVNIDNYFPYNDEQESHIFDLSVNTLIVKELSTGTRFIWYWDGHDKHTTNYIVPDEVWELQNYLERIANRID